MANNEADRLYDLEFGVEVSTVYHDWRRSTAEFWGGFVRMVTLLGAIVTLLTGFATWLNDTTIIWVIIASIVIAIVTLFDLVFRSDIKARVHTDLYERFKQLQAEIAKRRPETSALLNEWEARAQEIRIDEPPVLWAVYVTAWNQVLSKRKVHPGHMRHITRWQALAGRLFAYRPQDFPIVGAKA